MTSKAEVYPARKDDRMDLSSAGGVDPAAEQDREASYL